MNSSRATLLVVAVSVGLLAPSAVFAQDDSGTMTFGEDEAKEIQEEGSDSDQGGDEGTMSFGEEEAKEATGNPTVGVVAVPGKAINDTQRSKLQQELAKQMQQVPNIQLQRGPAVYNALQQRTPQTCVTEPLCLGSVGDDVGVDRIAMVRVKQDGGTFNLDLDYFNVEDRLFTKYRSTEELGNFNAVVAEVEPLVKDMFGLTKRKEPDYVSQNTRKARTIIAIASAGLSAVSIGLGIYFGNQASQIESELNGADQNDNGVYTDLTQKEAQQKLQNAQEQAALANVSYGFAGAFAIASGVLFVLNATSKSGPEQQKQSEKSNSKSAGLLQRIEIVPTVGREGAGLSAGFRF